MESVVVRGSIPKDVANNPQCLVDLPFRIYTANIPTDQIFLVIARQIVWTAILVLLGRWLLARGMRRIVIQGG